MREKSAEEVAKERAEFAKAYVCWLAYEGIVPKDSKPCRDVFRNHIIRNQLLISLIFPIYSSIHGIQRETTDEEILSWWNQLGQYSERARRFQADGLV
jgi:hypothetical protein